MFLNLHYQCQILLSTALNKTEAYSPTTYPKVQLSENNRADVVNDADYHTFYTD